MINARELAIEYRLADRAYDKVCNRSYVLTEMYAEKMSMINQLRQNYIAINGGCANLETIMIITKEPAA